MDANKKNISDATITLECNNNCIFCPRKLLANISCNVESFRRIREESDSITLTGGEVTILPNFFSIVEKCKGLGFKEINMITNARMLSNRKFSTKLIRLGISAVGISVYSTNPKIHDLITRVKGSCIQTLEGVQNLIGQVRQLWVNITVSKYNCDDLAVTIHKLHAMGVREFLLISVVTREKDVLYDPKVILGQFKKLSVLGLSNAKITFRGFSSAINKEIRTSTNHGRHFFVEDHSFDTFVQTNDKTPEYFKELGKVLK